MTGPTSGGSLRLRLLLIAFIVGGVVLSAAASLFLRDSGPKLMVVAHFDDASPLLEGNDVRSHGVRVGTIATIVARGQGADVTLELERGALPVHQDASVTIRPVSLLGERYVDLDPGSLGAPLMSDRGEIDVAKTGQATGLDEVLNTLDAPTSQSLGLLVAALGSGLDKNGVSLRDAVKALAPAATRTDELVQVLRTQNGTLAQLVDSLAPVAEGLAADDGRSVDALIESSRNLLVSTAANDAAFRAMLEALPATMRAARTTLSKLEAAANETTPTLASLRPTTANLDSMSSELQAFASAADPALRSAAPVLDKAEELLRKARPVAAMLRAQGPSLQSAASDARPLSAQLRGRFTSVMEFFKGWALSTNARDGIAHYFRGGLVLTPYSATGLLPNLQPPTSTGKNTVKTPQLPLVPGLNDLLGDVLPGLSGLTGGLLSPRTDATGGVTGLTSVQELDALGFLLGGS